MLVPGRRNIIDEEVDMAKYLVIVESPAKVKTISKFLGSNYTVMASQGHVRDLPKSSLGVDVDNDYEPKYITIRGKGELLASLRKEVRKAEKIYLATDPDREGEAISWHLTYALNLQDKKVYRITFNEITRNAVKESIKNAREIDMDLVDAQQARRCLDRVVGYRISPLLWAKIKRGLSAGRVQSVALRIICDREEEIEKFVPEEYWTLDAEFEIPGASKPLVAHYYGDEDGKKEVPGEKDADAIISAVKGREFEVREVRNSTRTRKAPLPFTTSTLQQEASRKLGFSTQKTMRLAQQLYEGVEIKGQGTIGLITYLRTDSTRVSDEAQAAAAAYVEETYGERYAAAKPKAAREDRKIQDAHEAIRPADVTLTPAAVKGDLGRDLLRLYGLIWKRFTASRMSDATYDVTAVRLGAGGQVFTVSASTCSFDGFLSVYNDEDDEKENNVIPVRLRKGQVLPEPVLDKKQHFTQSAPHYTEASLVRAMEELGIGRPSTYAPTITTILGRRYVIKEDKNLYVTELGEVVNKMMKENFPTIVDVNFTANMEALLDGVEEGRVKWKTILENFYPDLDEAVKTAEKNLEHVKVADEESDEVCELCGRRMVYKYGPHGKFLACPGFPECRNTKPFLEKIGVPCPKCGQDLVVRKTKKGRRYYGCSGYPDCDYMSWQKPKEAAKLSE